ncbi:hypothetical protein [Corynebacterium sp. EPI-003-04-2554_SCH2473622]|uniref:hypothetical protein n=1 Tax=Corynebacterium sp. EPI-003-04-2554_SCH2473622 TaxID=1834153 RepID=UPI0007E96890|nr:hypothetical protein [Corynebacterium sp. EPI-003-04-2554_SCH2473622]OBA53024.1 hypothetical protein A5774_07815 [Corynebacterium sp. EPI-003-04-2554_SCH2473622]
MNPVTPRLAGSNIDLYIEHLNAINSKIQESNRPESYKDGYAAATKLATNRIAELWESAVRSALAINEMLAQQGQLDEDLDDAFETAQAIANNRKSKTD